MVKRKIIYSLTDRGLFSELLNLALAKVYADYCEKKIIVNTRHWNVRVKFGLADYFISNLECTNNIMSSQQKIYTLEKPWFGKIYYKPLEFFTFYFFYFLNKIYCIFHSKTELSKEIFPQMRSMYFLETVLEGKSFDIVAATFKKIFIYNEYTEQYIRNEIAKLNLPKDYIGVHIRRGDKIISKEMNNINLDIYIREIINRKSISSEVYVATDDVAIISLLRDRLFSEGIHVFFNETNAQNGFDETSFNLSDKKYKHFQTLNMLLDFDVLIHSRFFIGTYTSNVSRVIPFYLGLDKCCSLDKEWNILNS